MAQRPISQTQARKTIALVDKHEGNISAAAREAKVNYSTFISRVRAAKLVLERAERQAAAMTAAFVDTLSAPNTLLEDLATEPPTPEPEEIPLAEREKRAYEDRIRSLEKALKEVNKEELTAEKISAYYFDLKEQVVELPDWVVETRAGTGTAGVPVTNWSDWHYSEQVNPAEVEHVNEFSVPVFERRLRMLVDRLHDLCFHHMTNSDYPGIVVNLGGDMLSGHIHEELAKTNQRETIPATLDLAGYIAWALRSLADKFKRVLVVGVPGNHGRNTKKPVAKSVCFTSFDWMTYKIVQGYCRDDDRLTFLVPDSFDAYYRVYGHRVLLTHGDRIGSKGGDGFIGSIGPIMRGVKKLRLAYGVRGREIDTVLMGHWHTEWHVPGLRVNNCLKGYDEWAQANRFEPTPPSQDLFFIHPTRGITCSWPVQLEGPQRIADRTEWASVPK